ncbi:MAG: N-acetylneuraminate synthase family protein, partial [Pirellulaceae bacterium]|nr:N-acetylneuraminate synthase family protein [Pirellulaceae bacterium]
MSNIHIIAEAGTNHNASPHTAEQLIDAAGDCGADSVKFQIIYPEGLYVSKIYRDGVYSDNDVIAVRRAGMLADDDYRRLATYSSGRGVPMSASIFCPQGLALLEELDPPYIKIASCDLNNTRLLKQAAEIGRKLIVSTGMAALGEVERAVADITSTGCTDLVLMHCVSVYPCPTAQTNLGFIRVLQSAFGFPVGLSDHTENSLAAAAAVAMGVSWIEKHYTLNRASSGFDHAYAMEPAMLKNYIDDVRAIESACLPGSAKVGESESTTKLRARRGLFA